MSIVERTRRLGERHPATGVTVDWDTSRTPPRRLGRSRPRQAYVLDVSVTGALLVARRNPRLAVGERVTIGAGGSFGTVRISRIADLPETRHSAYGAEFVELDEPLRAMLYSLIAADRPPDVDVIWQSAE